jgi:hypothetical protein
MNVQHNSNDFKHKKFSISQAQLTDASQRTLGNLKKFVNKKMINEIAWESKLIQRESSKIGGFDFLSAMILSNLNAEHATLINISDVLNTLNHRLRMSPQSIMERLNSEASSHFFQMIFKNILKNQMDSLISEVSSKLLDSFNKILIQDSSSFDLNEKLSKFFKGSGGRASKATAKIDVIYDFKAKRFEHIKLTDHSEADQKLSLDILDFLVPNSLIIRDLGYLRMDCIIKINEL